MSMGVVTVASNSDAGSGVRLELLESTAIRATFWTVMEYGCSVILRVVNSLVLTRLLVPEYFGLMALVMTLVVGVGLMSDFGLGPSVIRSPQGDDPNLLNTVWTLQVVRGFIILAVLRLLTWPMARIYREPRLLSLLPALGVSVLASLVLQHEPALHVPAHEGVAAFPGRYFGSDSRSDSNSWLCFATPLCMGPRRWRYRKHVVATWVELLPPAGAGDVE